MELLSNKQIFNKINTDNTLDNRAVIEMCSMYFDNIKDPNYYELSIIGRRLRKIKPQLFLDGISFMDIEQIKSNQYICNAFLYCFYESKIKNYTYSENTLNEYLNNANYIVSNCAQLPGNEMHLNPYVITIYSVVKTLLKNYTNKYQIALEWINLINIDDLDDSTFEITSNEGKNYELASYKEFFYQSKTKCYEKTFQYKECVDICNKALQTLSKLHYGNQMWFNARKLYSLCMINPSSENINNYTNLAEDSNQWHLYHKLSNIFFSQGQLNEALYYSCKAFVINRVEEESMVNLFYDIATLLNNLSLTEEAKLFYTYSLYIKSSRGWKISEELKFKQKELSINEIKRPPIKKIYQIAINVVTKHDNLIAGRVCKYNKDKKFGFILTTQNKQYHFSKSRCYDYIKLHDVVLFDIIPCEKGFTCKHVYRKEK